MASKWPRLLRSRLKAPLRLPWLVVAETRCSSGGTCSVSDPAPTTRLPSARNETTTHLDGHPSGALDGTLHVVSALSIGAENVNPRSMRLSNVSAFIVRPAFWRHSTKETCRSGVERVRNVKLWQPVSCILAVPFFPSLFLLLLVPGKSRHLYLFRLSVSPLIGFSSFCPGDVFFFCSCDFERFNRVS
jgi:hypothetical protein